MKLRVISILFISKALFWSQQHSSFMCATTLQIMPSHLHHNCPSCLPLAPANDIMVPRSSYQPTGPATRSSHNMLPFMRHVEDQLTTPLPNLCPPHVLSPHTRDCLEFMREYLALTVSPTRPATPFTFTWCTNMDQTCHSRITC